MRRDEHARCREEKATATTVKTRTGNDGDRRRKRHYKHTIDEIDIRAGPTHMWKVHEHVYTTQAKRQDAANSCEALASDGLNKQNEKAPRRDRYLRSESGPSVPSWFSHDENMKILKGAPRVTSVVRAWMGKGICTVTSAVGADIPVR